MNLKIPPVESLKRPVVSATFRIATPMYLHGADTGEVVERILPQSVKGALRFWWRAVHWADYLSEAESALREESRQTQDKKAHALALLAKADARLWGAADEAIGQGQALMQLGLDDGGMKTGQMHTPPYLRGMGINKNSPALLPGQKFTLDIHLKSSADDLERDREQVRRTLQAFGLFGGLGSRARHGLGSVQLVELDGVRFDTWQAQQDAIAKLLQHGQKAKGEPPYTALSEQTRCYFIERNTTAEVLNEISQELMTYRSGFSEDADAILAVAQGGQAPANRPVRAVFGLPHNYFFKDEGVKAQVDGWYPEAKEKLRRASPLFIHAAEFQGKATGVLTLFPADFLPESGDGSARLHIFAKGKKATPAFKPDWDVIKQFLMHELTDAKRIQP